MKDSLVPTCLVGTSNERWKTLDSMELAI